MQAVILAGGLGTRLREKVSDKPKPMAEFSNKPLLAYLIEQLKEFEEIIILIGYKGDVIKNYFGDGSKFGIPIRYSEEEEPLGTGGALKKAQDLIKGDFILINGDNYHELNYKELKKIKENTMILTKTINPTQVTIIKTDINGKVTELKERPKEPTPDDKYMNAGILVLKKEVLKLLPEGKSSMELIIFPELVKLGLKTIIYKGYYIDIGTPENYDKFMEYQKNNPLK